MKSVDWIRLHESPLDWAKIEAALPFSDEMRACIQDVIFHQEGNVLLHTRSVCEALLSDPEFAEIEPARKPGLFLAALLHDVAKPATREVVFDAELGRERTTHRGHSLKGAKMAWSFLWREELPRALREQVFALILWHQRVFHVMGKENARRDIILFSILGRWRELIMLARADNKGRIAPNTKETAETLELTHMLAEEEGCLDGPWPFESAEAQVKFAHDAGASPFYNPQPATGSRVVVLWGLPGAGKDTYAARVFPSLPVISLDDIRKRMHMKPGDNDGSAIQAAYEEARAHLRARTPFVWNATNLTRLLRDKIIDLCLAYDAYVEIHAIDRTPAVTLSQNKAREAAVPESIVERMVRNWEPPTPAEAHALVWAP